MKVLLCRNDKIGDVTLALPSIDYLRTSLPKDAFLAVLVTEYAQDVVKKSNLVDEIILDDKDDARLTNKLKQYNFDAAIVLFSTWRLAKLLYKAGIAYRLAPATKPAQIWYNKLLSQKRSKSLQPEYQYNIDLVNKFLIDHEYKAERYTLQPPYLLGECNILPAAYQQESEKIKLIKNNGDLLIAISLTDGGSAPNNLSPNQYLQLVELLNERVKCCWLFTCDYNNHHKVNELCAKLPDSITYFVMAPRKLGEFIDLLAACDFLIGGSTGPLHLAAALNKPVIAFYPKQKAAGSLRWQVISDKDKCLSIKSNNNHAFEIDIESVSEEIYKHIISLKGDQ